MVVLSHLYLIVAQKRKISFLLMILALVGLFVLQAFWVYDSYHSRNQYVKSKLESAEIILKEKLEEDYFCFMLSRTTQIKLGDSLGVYFSDSGKLKPLGEYKIETPDTSFTYPKDKFSFRIPTWLQMEFRFDYLVDSLSQSELERDSDLMEMFNDYRLGAIKDSMNGLRVAYKPVYIALSQMYWTQSGWIAYWPILFITRKVVEKSTIEIILKAWKW